MGQKSGALCAGHDGVGVVKRGGNGRVRIFRGGRKPAKDAPIVPIEALKRRAEQIGLHERTVTQENKQLCNRLQFDGAMTSALGKMMWEFDGEGRRMRRMLSHGPQAGRDPVITDGMELAALRYRRLWVTWMRTNGMPDQRAKALDLSMIKVDGGASIGHLDGDSDDADAEKASAKLRFADDILAGLPAADLVKKSIETVVIEDVFLPMLLDRPAALSAFRSGLAALEKALIRKFGP